MQTEPFLAKVERRGGLSSTADARAATAAVLETLSERLSAGEAANIGSQLPTELATDMAASVDEGAEEFSAAEFVKRVQARESPQGIPGAVEEHIRAVTTVLGKAVSSGELDDAREQLPTEFEVLFEPIDMSEEQR